MDEGPYSYRHKEGTRAQKGCLMTFIVWMACVAWLVSVGSDNSSSGVGYAVSMLSYLVVGILGPAVGILQAFDLKPYLDWKTEKTASTRFFQFLTGMGMWLAAVVLVFMGLSLAFGAVFSPNKGEGLISIPATLVGVAFGAVLTWGGVLLFRYPFRKTASTTESEDTQSFQRRLYLLENPDFESIESKYAIALPEAYKAMHVPDSEWYQPDWMLFPKGLHDDSELYHVMDREPASLDAIRLRPEMEGVYLCFGRGEFDEYWILLGPPDPPVFMFMFEEPLGDKDIEKIAERFSDFLSWAKEKQ